VPIHVCAVDHDPSAPPIRCAPRRLHPDGRPYAAMEQKSMTPVVIHEPIASPRGLVRGERSRAPALPVRASSCGNSSHGAGRSRSPDASPGERTARRRFGARRTSPVDAKRRMGQRRDAPRRRSRRHVMSPGTESPSRSPFARRGVRDRERPARAMNCRTRRPCTGSSRADSSTSNQPPGEAIGSCMTTGVMLFCSIAAVWGAVGMQSGRAARMGRK